jgi:pimeloyl-ACP methyl ester carboxylesterase
MRSDAPVPRLQTHTRSPVLSFPSLRSRASVDTSRMRAMLTTMLSFIAIAIGAFILLCAYLYVRQDRLLFYPRPNDASLREHWRTKRIEITSGNHVLEGWWADGGAPSSETVIVYFGGNAEDVLGTARIAQRLACKRMLVVNYRGYGSTKGRPGQEALYEDALAIYAYAIGAGGAEPEHIVVMGRSLGSGVATMLAARRSVRAAILITPYDSILAVAARHYGWFPVERLLRHRFPSVDFARETQVPALFLIAANDVVIPPSHGRALAAAWSGEKTVHVLERVGHNDHDLHPSYYEQINSFLQSVAIEWRPDSQHAAL